MTARQLITLVICVLLWACSDSAEQVDRKAGVALIEGAASKVILQSQARAGGAIAVQTRVLTEVRLNQPVIVELTVSPGNYRQLWLTIADSEHFALQGEYQRWLGSSHQQPVIEQITLTPLSAGKHYLRMTLAQEDGSNPRSVVVALKVVGDTDLLPAERELPKERIEFQSRPVN